MAAISPRCCRAALWYVVLHDDSSQPDDFVLLGIPGIKRSWVRWPRRGAAYARANTQNTRPILRMQNMNMRAYIVVYMVQTTMRTGTKMIQHVESIQWISINRVTPVINVRVEEFSVLVGCWE